MKFVKNVFISIWTNLGNFHCSGYTKKGTRLDELSFVVRLGRHSTEGYPSRRIIPLGIKRPMARTRRNVILVSYPTFLKQSYKILKQSEF